LCKLLEGAWFPIAVGLIIFLLMTTWSTGRRLMREGLLEDSLPLAVFIKSTAATIHRVRGTAVFLSASPEVLPAALLHNLKHNQVLHERVVLLTVAVEEVPQVDPAARGTVHTEGHRLLPGDPPLWLHGRRRHPRDLAASAAEAGLTLEPLQTSYFLSRQKLIASCAVPGMALWRERLFAWMLKVSENAMGFSSSPPTAWSNSAANSGSEQKALSLQVGRWVRGRLPTQASGGLRASDLAVCRLPCRRSRRHAASA